MCCNKNEINNKLKLNILLYGDSASSHIIAESILKSDKINKLYVFGKNKLIKTFGTGIDVDGTKLINFAKNHNINLLVCDSEINIEGIVSLFQRNGIKSLGITQKWAKLEGSKLFGKKFAEKYDIPIPQYCIAKNFKEFCQIIDTTLFPIVIKADGYLKGRGTHIARNRDEAINAYKEIVNTRKYYQNVSSIILIEKFIEGDELSYICVWNGNKLIPCAYIKDYKKLSINSNINTASMGAYYSKDIISNKRKNMILNYHNKLENALKDLKADFTGPIYSGLIFSDSSYSLLEYNMRFGTTESHILFSNMTDDFINFAINLVEGKLNEFPFNYNETVCCTVLYAKGYPYNTTAISLQTEILQKLENEYPNIKIYFNKVSKEENSYIIDKDSCIYLICKDKKPQRIINSAIKKFFAETMEYRLDIGR